jgi:nitroreductase
MYAELCGSRDELSIFLLYLKTVFIEAIRDRRSCRTFDPRPIEPHLLTVVQDLIRSPLIGPFGGAARFSLVDVGPRGQKRRRLGTYGFVQGAPAFLVGAIASGEYALEDYGWCMEKVVLELTWLGLGTCWLGGTFRRSAFARAAGMVEGEIIPAVTPVGLPAGTKSAIDAFASAVSGARGRKRWEELFLLPREDAGEWTACLDAVRAAPSAMNGQPWRVAMDAAAPVLHFYRVSRVQMERRTLQNVDMGIAMCHFELAARELGLGGSWRVLGDVAGRAGLAYLASWDGRSGRGG